MDNGFYNYRWTRKPDRESFFADEHYFQNTTRLIEYDFDVASELRVPGDWNTQDPMYLYYEGTIWYRRTFNASPKPGMRYYLWFGAVNYEAIVGLNGRSIGEHRGGFTPFDFEVTDLLNGLSPWILKDFRSPRRQLAIIQGVYNRKGLLDENGTKKDCWQILHDWYETK